MRRLVCTILCDTRLSGRCEMVRQCFLHPSYLEKNVASNTTILGSRKMNAPTSKPGLKKTKVAPLANVVSLSETFSIASRISNSSSADSCISDSSFPVSPVFC